MMKPILRMMVFSNMARISSGNKRNKNQSKFHHGHEFGAIGWLCETPQGVRLFPLAARVISSLAVLKRICAQMPAGLIVFDR